MARLGGCVSLSMAEGAPSVSEFRIQIRYGGRFSIQNTADQRDGEERWGGRSILLRKRSEQSLWQTWRLRSKYTRSPRENFPLPFLANTERSTREIRTLVPRYVSEPCYFFFREWVPQTKCEKLGIPYIIATRDNKVYLVKIPSKYKVFLFSDELHPLPRHFKFLVEIKFSSTGNIPFYRFLSFTVEAKYA